MKKSMGPGNTGSHKARDFTSKGKKGKSTSKKPSHPHPRLKKSDSNNVSRKFTGSFNHKDSGIINPHGAVSKHHRLQSSDVFHDRLPRSELPTRSSVPSRLTTRGPRRGSPRERIIVDLGTAHPSKRSSRSCT